MTTRETWRSICGSALLLITACATKSPWIPPKPEVPTLPSRDIGHLIHAASIGAYDQDLLADMPLFLWGLDGSAVSPVEDPGGALTRSGVDARIRWAKVPSLRSFSLELWAKDVRGTLAEWRTEESVAMSLVALSPETWRFRLGSSEVLLPADLSPDSWHHVGLSWDGSRGVVMLVVDGIPATRELVPETTPLPAGDLWLGSNSSPATGQFDHAALFGTALHDSRWLHRMGVHRGHRTPTPIDARQPLRFQPQRGHGTPVVAVRATPDLTLAVSAERGHQTRGAAYNPGASSDRSLRIWNLESGLLVSEIPRSAPVADFTISQDGTLLYIGSSAGLETVNLETGQSEGFYKDPAGWPGFISMSDDGRLALIVTKSTSGSGERARTLNRRARVVDLQTSEVLIDHKLHFYRGYPDPVHYAGVTPSGKLSFLLQGTRCSVWDNETKQALIEHTKSCLDLSVTDERTAFVLGEEVQVISGDEITTVTLPERKNYDRRNIRLAGDYLWVDLEDLSLRSVYDLRDGSLVKSIGRQKKSTPSVHQYSYDARHGLLIHKGRDAVSALLPQSMEPAPPDTLKQYLEVNRVVRFDVQGSTVALEALQPEPVRLAEVSRRADALADEVEFDPSGRYVATVGLNYGIYVWDIQAGRLAATLDTSTPDGRPLFRVASVGVRVKVIQDRFLRFSPGGKYLVAAGRVWKVGTWEMVHDLALPTSRLQVSFSRDDRYLSAISGSSSYPGSGNGHLKIIDLEQPEAFLDLHSEEAMWTGAAISSDGSEVAVASISWSEKTDSSSAYFEILDAGTGVKKRRIPLGGDIGEIYAVGYSQDDRYVSAKTWGMHRATGFIHKDLRPGDEEAPEAPSPNVEASADGKIIAFVNDSLLTVVNPTNDEKVHFIARQEDWAAFTPDGYFAGSSGATRLVAGVQGTRGMEVDQLAESHNRPDLIVERMGGSNALVAHFRARHETRLKGQGVAAGAARDAAPAPWASIRSGVVEGTGAQSIAVLETECFDPSGVSSYALSVDGVPVLGERLPSPQPRWLKLLRLPLAAGDNLVEFSCSNSSGVQAQRARMNLSVEGEQTPPRLYFVGLGVSEYPTDSGISSLDFADQDAKDLADAFRSYGGKFSEVRTKTWVNKEVHRRVLGEVTEFIADARHNDVVVLFVAGHGVRDSDEARTYYYLNYDARLGDTAKTAIPFESLESVFSGTKARRRLLLLDTCESGERVSLPTTAAIGEQVRARTIRGLTVEAKNSGGGTVVDVDVLDALRGRKRLIYENFARRLGVRVLASSLGSEASLESGAWRNGAFTEVLLRAMSTAEADLDENGTLSLEELADYTLVEVPKITENHQHPSLRGNRRVSFELMKAASP